jgi:putative oxygen-independent coproporphyrinogen III oxidase
MASSAVNQITVPLSQLGGRKAAAGLVNLTVLPPLSLYIHWPWCVRKCPYCDFNSHEFNSSTLHATPASTLSHSIDEASEARYIQALLRDLEHELPNIWGRRVYTVFIGGGTPSLMRPQALDTLLAGVRARLPLEADAEITLEANPGTVEAHRFAAYADAGVNRISVGVQSFNPTHLSAIGRIHNGDQAIQAVQAAVQFVPKVNVDIMYGLPQQTVAQAQQDIAQALDLGVGHISAYHLTLEPNTFFNRYPPTLPDDDTCADMQQANTEALLAAGFAHYETSAYAKAQQRCQHNQNYWSFGDYIGIGAGAHGKISFPDRIVRTVKYKHPKAYMDALEQGSFMQSQVTVAAKELPFEFMLNALRLQQGFDLAWFTERTGQPLSLVQTNIKALQDKKLLEFFNPPPSSQATWLRPTALGHRFLNDVVDAFL